jgi:uncharacterized damage-inducible protein DinB
MTIAEILLQDYDVEISNTRRTLERVPEGKNDFKCHEKSMPLGKLAMHCATMPLFGSYIILDDGMDLANPARPHSSLVFESRDECLKQLEESATACRNAIAAASDEALLATWPFQWGEQIISKNSRLLSFRQMCFNHLIHHTAQLGVYLRLNDIPVPSLYGPSADEQWGK